MQTVKITKEYFDSFEKNAILTLEQAQWYTQNEGFIPVPRKANKKNIKVMFFNSCFPTYLCLFKEKIKRYRVSAIIDNDGIILGYIFAIEVKSSLTKKNYYYLYPFHNIPINYSSLLDKKRIIYKQSKRTYETNITYSPQTKLICD